MQPLAYILHVFEGWDGDEIPHPWLEECHPLCGEQASPLCGLLILSVLTVKKRLEQPVSVLLLEKKTSETITEPPTLPDTVWHRLPPTYSLPSHHTPFRQQSLSSVGSDLSKQINKKQTREALSLACSRTFSVYWTALGCVCVCNACITSLQNNSVYFLVNNDKRVHRRSAHTYLFLPWQWWVRPLVFVLFSPECLYFRCRGYSSQAQTFICYFIIRTLLLRILLVLFSHIWRIISVQSRWAALIFMHV